MAGNLEYEKLYFDATQKLVSNSDDVYTNLMKKESTVLDVVNKVVNQKEELKMSTSLFDKPVRQIVYLTYVELMNIVKDVQENQPLSKIISSDRHIYIGLFFVSVSTILVILYYFD